MYTKYSKDQFFLQITNNLSTFFLEGDKMKNVILVLVVLFILTSCAWAQKRSQPTRQGFPMPSRQAKSGGGKGGFPIPGAKPKQMPCAPMKALPNGNRPQYPYGHKHGQGHGKKRPIVVISGGGVVVDRVVVVPTQNQQNNGQEQSEQFNLQKKIEQARISAIMLPNIYLQFEAFCRIADVSGEEKDMDSAFNVAMNMKPKDRNDALLFLTKLAVYKRNVSFAEKVSNKILHPQKRNAAKQAIVDAGGSLSVDAKKVLKKEKDDKDDKKKDNV